MKNMRQRPRVEISHQISYTCHDGNDEYSKTDTGILLNISTNGALIEAKQPFTGKYLVLANNNKTNPRLVKGEIVYEETVIAPEGNASGLYRAGIKFTDLHENSKEFVVSIVQPDAANGNGEDEENSAKNVLEFDFDSINQILTDDTPTEDIILIEELLEEDEGIDSDVLEDIAQVLKETSSPGPETNNVSKTEPENNKPGDIQSERYNHSNFLPNFNKVCLSLTALVIITVFFLKVTGFYSDSITLIPWNHNITADVNSEKEKNMLKEINNERPVKTVFLINKSVKSRFEKKENEAYHFIINGLVTKPLYNRQEDIIVTAKIFSKNNSLLGRASVTLNERSPDSVLIKEDNQSKVLPFLITFTNPPKDISRFSVDLDI